MFSIHRLELDWIAALQGSGTLRELMVWFSYLGSEALPFVLAIVYFALSRRAGVYLYLLLPLSGALLHIFKLAFHLPRPYWIDSRIATLAGAGGYGLPSGHVLSATVVWPSVARALNISWAIAVMAILFVSISRIYLGVHFISDVVAAIAIGIGLLWSCGRLEMTVSRKLDMLPFSIRIAVSFWGAALLLAIGLAVRCMIDRIIDPPAWSMHSAGARDLGGLFRAVGEFFGAACGMILAARWAHFEIPRSVWKRAAACGYALAGLSLIHQLSKEVPTGLGKEVRLLCALLHGILSNLWMLFLTPWILLKMGLLHADSAGAGGAGSDQNK